MHKIVIFLSVLWLSAVLSSARADSYTLTDGNVLSGDVIKSDENGLMLRQPGDIYTNLAWGMLSQDTLKQLSQNTKLTALVQPFLEPEPVVRAPKPVINVHDVVRLNTPPPTSVLGGFLTSSVGILLGLLIYAANLYAGYEIAVCCNRPVVTVMLISGIFPIIGPAIFALLPVQFKREGEDEAPIEDETAPTERIPVSGSQSSPRSSASALPSDSEPQPAVSATYAQPPQKQQTQVFQRGKFMFNKRFVETKFGLFLKGASNDFVLVIITAKGQFTVNRLGELSPAEMQVFCDDGEAQIPYTDIQEAQIKPRTK